MLKLPEMTNIAVIINEVGEVGIDHLLLETPRKRQHPAKPHVQTPPVKSLSVNNPQGRGIF
ncbi:MAG: hypothetical protein JWR16_3615 [Nevskia sp.]|nr:hypothetical protein [Nevskia sp.]